MDCAGYGVILDKYAKTYHLLPVLFRSSMRFSSYCITVKWKNVDVFELRNKLLSAGLLEYLPAAESPPGSLIC